MPCSGPVPSTPTGPYDDVYGGYAYGGPARTRVARRVTPETTGSVTDSAELAQSCGGLAPGVTDLPIDKIQQSLQLNDDQLKSLNALKAASSQASDALKASCSGEISMTPLGRLDTVQKRLDGMVQAWGTLRTPLDGFYNSLNDEQRQRFAALGPASSAAFEPPWICFGRQSGCAVQQPRGKFHATACATCGTSREAHATAARRTGKTKDRLNGGRQSVAGILPCPVTADANRQI